MEKKESFVLSGFTCVNFDLRFSIKEKVEEAKKHSTKWTILMNNSGSLAHVVSKSGLLIRIPNYEPKADEAYNWNFYVRECKALLK